MVLHNWLSPHAEVLLFNLDLQLTIAEGTPLLLQLILTHLNKLHLNSAEDYRIWGFWFTVR